MRTKAFKLEFPDHKFVDATDLAHFLFLFRGAYASCSSILTDRDLRRHSSEEFETLIREHLRRLNVVDIDALFTRGLGRKTLVVRKLSFGSPLEIAVTGVIVLLAVAVTLSGGKFKLGPLQVTLPPIGEGIKRLRQALSPTVKAPLGYGIRSRTIKLSRVELGELMKHDPASEFKGGFQRLLIGIQYRVNKQTGEVTLFYPEMDAIIRHCRNASKGGWQGSIEKIFGKHFFDIKAKARVQHSDRRKSLPPPN